MIRGTKEMQSWTIQATDGPIGRISDFYFDHKKWTVRYLVVETAERAGRTVLISPIAIRSVDPEGHRLQVHLTQEQVAKSPDIDTAKPISRQHEIEYSRYYGWPYYWAGSGLWGEWLYPGALALPATPAASPPSLDHPVSTGPGNADPHLCSVQEVIGYTIHARDGHIGHIDDLLIEDQTWRIDYVLVDTSGWRQGKRVLISPSWITRVEWADQEVYVDLARDTVEHSPEFAPGAIPNRR